MRMFFCWSAPASLFFSLVAKNISVPFVGPFLVGDKKNGFSMSVLNPDDKTKVKIILHQMIAEQYLTLTV
jgi:hypothetical protein